jgi:hypothetical protein
MLQVDPIQSYFKLKIGLLKAGSSGIYSKNYDFVPLPTHHHFKQVLPIVHHRDTIVPDRSTPFIMVLNHF